MSRQVDVKALITHIVRGDGADKCRICMGETTEGQVYLGDTVMMDGNRPVTLSELLETITGVQVMEEESLPSGACHICFYAAMNAHQFRSLCLQSHEAWETATDSMLQIEDPMKDDKTYYVIYNNGIDTVMRDQISKVSNASEVIERITAKSQDFDDQDYCDLEDEEIIVYPSVKCKCPDCGKRFAMPQSLNVHLKLSLKRACLTCGAVVPRSQLVKHMSGHNEQVIYCSICYKIFETLSRLQSHWDSSHAEGLDNYCCDVCGETYSNARALRAHMYSHGLFECRNCRKSFENRKCYRYHLKNCISKDMFEVEPLKFDAICDAKPQLFICDDCGAEYDKKPSLKMHILHKHLYILPFVCQTCGKRTSTLAHLKSHQATHSQKREMYLCHCGAQMRTLLGYQLHQRIHSGEKPYKCSECDESFLSASRRLDHVKRRHRSIQDMPHKCAKCSARFVRPFELKKHYSLTHNIVVNVKPLKRKLKGHA